MISEPMIRARATVTPAQGAAAPAHGLPPGRHEADHETDAEASPDLPAHITRAASKQAYYTIRLLVDRDRRAAAYRAYAYFRWVDDQIDRPVSDRAARMGFVGRQRDLIERARRGCSWGDLAPEERLVVDLIQGDDEPTSGLQSYITNMLAVMAFDASRRGRWVSERELDHYTRQLSVAVTDALHYFIGHTSARPASELRYLPAMAAHVSHMLRDTLEDVALGYFNVPREWLAAGDIGPGDVQSPAYRAWVKHRVQLARTYFAQGTRYLAQVQSARCRLAGFAYMARFTGVLDAIEREAYRVRPASPEFTHPGYALRVGGSVVRSTLLRGTP